MPVDAVLATSNGKPTSWNTFINPKSSIVLDMPTKIKRIGLDVVADVNFDPGLFGRVLFCFTTLDLISWLRVGVCVLDWFAGKQVVLMYILN